MRGQLVCEETLLLAEKKGFSKGEIPTQSSVQIWLRKVHNIHISVEFADIEKWYCWIYKKIKVSEDPIVTKFFTTYEEALEVGIQKALNLLD